MDNKMSEYHADSRKSLKVMEEEKSEDKTLKDYRKSKDKFHSKTISEEVSDNGPIL